MATLVLVHSPLVGPSTWLRLAPELERRGHTVAVPSLQSAATGGGPYADAFAQTVSATLSPAEDVVLIAHSGAGLFLPAIAGRLERLAGCLFIDATLSRDGECWLDTVPAEVRESQSFRQAAARGVVPNPWTDPALWRTVGITDEPLAALLAREAIEPSLALYEERVYLPPNWPGVPAGYLAFVPNPFYAPLVQQARAAGWLVRELPGTHFEMLVRPDAVADEIEVFVDAFGARSHDREDPA